MVFVEGGKRFVQNCLRAVDILFLRKIAYGNSLRDNDIALRRLFQSADELQQRGLACAVFAHQADAILLANQEGNVGEEVLTGEVHAQVLD